MFENFDLELNKNEENLFTILDIHVNFLRTFYQRSQFSISFIYVHLHSFSVKNVIYVQLYS